MKLPKEKFTLEEKIRLLEEGLNPETNPSLETVFIDLSNPYRSGRLEPDHLPIQLVKARTK